MLRPRPRPGTGAHIRSFGRVMIAAGTLICVAAGLTGCGQKGPLFLPDEPKEVVTRPAQSAESAPAQESVPTPEDAESQTSQKKRSDGSR